MTPKSPWQPCKFRRKIRVCGLRQGNAIAGGGEVTSGTLSPCLERGIGMAYVPAAAATIGTELEIDVRGRVRPATVVEKPFVKKRA